MNTRTLPIAKAVEAAADSGMPDFIGAVQQAMDEGWSVVDFTLTEDGGNVEIAPHTGVMVAWMLPDFIADRLRLDGGEQDLHVTLAYLGDVSGLDYKQQRTLVGVVAEVVNHQTELYGLINGLNQFTPSDSSDGAIPWFAQVIAPGLEEMRAELVERLQAADLPVDVETHPDYTPHITLAYYDDEERVPQNLTLEPIPFDITELTVCIGTERTSLRLQAPDFEYYDDGLDRWVESGWYEQRRAFYAAETNGDGYPWMDASAYRPFAKALEVEERRFTLGPWYIPDTEDAHGDWTDPDTLQQALWDYVDAGYRGIHLQHMPDTVAGRWVELMTLPHETTWPVIDPNATTTEHTYPAGTVLMGVIWDEWAWELVKTGKITGYSIGGNANMSDEQLVPAAAEVAAPAVTPAPAPTA